AGGRGGGRGVAARGHELHGCWAGAGEVPEGVPGPRVPIVRAGGLLRLLSFALAAPRAVAREPWDVVVGFGRTPRQDIVRVGGGTHRSYLARMAGGGPRSRPRRPPPPALPWPPGPATVPPAARRPRSGGA